MSTTALPPVTALRQFDTCRLIPSRFAAFEDAVLAPLAEGQHELNAIFELDNATNERLQGEQGRLHGIGVDELLFGVPNFRMVNAAFTYARPEGSRFNDAERGAWYCAFTLKAAVAEMVFHKTVEYHEINQFNDSVSYQLLLADFNAGFHDLRGVPKYAACLKPDSYIASQKLAARLLAAGSLGVIYPSVRLTGGTNLACFRPALVGNVRRGSRIDMTWSGAVEPRIVIHKTAANESTTTKGKK